jgi:hypothetical protein
MGANQEQSGKTLKYRADIILSTAGELCGVTQCERSRVQPAADVPCANGVCAVVWKPSRPAAA